jgi:hypothetical protein
VLTQTTRVKANGPVAKPQRPAQDPAAIAALFGKQATGLRYIDGLDQRLKSLGIEGWVDADMDSLILMRLVIERTWMTAKQAMDTVERVLGKCPFETVSVSMMQDLPQTERLLLRVACVSIGGVQSV